MKNLVKSLLVTALLISPLMLTAGEGERRAANELLEVSQFEKMRNDSIDASIQMVKQMDPNMDSHEAALRQFYNKYMSAECLREDVINLYADVFTESELEEITAFYKTDTGQKSLEKLPELMQRSMQFAQTRVMENMSELQEMLSQGQADK